MSSPGCLLFYANPNAVGWNDNIFTPPCFLRHDSRSFLIGLCLEKTFWECEMSIVKFLFVVLSIGPI